MTLQAKGKKLTDNIGQYVFPVTRKEFVYSKWSGKKANFLGDSITAGTGTTKVYHQYLKENMELGLVRNYGISGSTIGNVSNPMHSRAVTMDADADLIVVFGGTNDFHFNVQFDNLFNTDANGLRTIPTNTNFFYPAMHQLCKNLIARYPGKQIVLCTPLHREVFGTQYTEFQKNNFGLYLEEYVDAIIEIGKWYSIPVCDLYRISGLQPNEPSNKALYFSPTDGLHPNAEGHRVIAEKLQAFIEQL